jgi:hypothetical protein
MAGGGVVPPPDQSIAGRVGVIATRSVVIAWGHYRCTDGSGTNAHPNAAARIASAISAAAIDAAHVSAADATYASIRQGIS